MKNKYIIYLPNRKIDTIVSSICMNLFLVCNKYGQTLRPRPYRQQRQDRCPEERGRWRTQKIIEGSQGVWPKVSIVRTSLE